MQGNVFVQAVGRYVGLRSFLALETTFVIFLCLTSKGYTSVRQTEDIDKDTGSLSSDESNPVDSRGYLVYSPSCRIPDLPPFHESIKQIYEKQKDAPCSSLPLLTSVSRKEGGHVLHLHKQYFALYSETNQTTCAYRKIWRIDKKPFSNNSEPDNIHNYGKWIEFYSDVTFNKTEEFIHVRCVANIGKEIDMVYTNVHAFVGLKPQVERKMREAHNKSKTGEKPLSVMILGFDSISRLNMMRTLPKTVKYLDRNGWVSLKGYNKIADNTLPNLMGILVGINMQQMKDAYWLTPNMSMDACPIIWKNFSQQGYITAYAEDTPFISTFNYHRSGFTESPTDYYLRPFMLAAYESTSKSVSRTKWSLGGEKEHLPLQPRHIECLGPFRATDHIFNYSLEFAATFRQYPTFSLFWFNGFSHDDINTPTMMDKHVRSYFKSLKNTGALNTTMVIFLSDHGTRFGKIRETYLGYMEERLPFIYFWLPEWFKSAYPTKAENLVKNANRLTSPFDVHMTLAEVLGVRTMAEGCPKCISLFKEVPSNRACKDAGITGHWCTCYELKPNESAPVQAIAEFVVDKINNILRNSTTDLQNGWQCSKLKLKKVLFIRSKVFLKPSDHQEFLIALQTLPGDALYEATVSQKTTTFNVDADGISRISTYSGQAHCMGTSYAEKYCFCENLSSAKVFSFLVFFFFLISSFFFGSKYLGKKKNLKIETTGSEDFTIIDSKG